ncbi:MAG: hypothetical protein ACK46D_07830, partial [Roseiflexaceae bacterium]
SNTVAANTRYMLTAQYALDAPGSGRIKLALSRVSAGNVTTTHNQSAVTPALRNLVEPLTLGNGNALTYDELRVYAGRVDEAHIQNMAEIFLLDRVNRLEHAAPQSSLLSIEANSQGQVINESTTSAPCTYNTDTTLLCEDLINNKVFNSDIRTTATAAQSSTYKGLLSASRAIDFRDPEKFSLFQEEIYGSVSHTYNPIEYAWWQMDMKGSQEIVSVDIIQGKKDRFWYLYDQLPDLIGGTNLTGARVYLNDTPFPTTSVTTPPPATVNYKANKSVVCDSTVATCETDSSYKHTVTFWPPKSAQYLRIQQTRVTQWLALAEV